MNARWIFSPLLDLSFMFIGLILFAITYFTNHIPSMIFTSAIFLAVILLDSGHVYLTYIRVWKEWRLIKKTTILLHLFIFLIFVAYQYFRLPYLWHFVVYATFFHFIRQFYGVLRWYMFINEKKHSYILDIFFYLTTLTPFLFLHFRPDLPPIGYYAAIDTFHYHSATLFNFFVNLNWLFLIGWISYEITFYYKYRELQLTRLLYLTTTIILFNLIAFLANSNMMIILPIVSAHGWQYYILLTKQSEQNHFHKVLKTALIVLFVGGILGYLNSYGEEEYDMTYLYLHSIDWENIIAVSLLLTPLFLHYILDMIIWKRGYMQKVKELAI